jgi:alpha-ketoglutarate-dependent taurine dioxygenase
MTARTHSRLHFDPVIDHNDGLLGAKLLSTITSERFAIVRFGDQHEASQALGSLQKYIGERQEHKHNGESGYVIIGAGAYDDGVRRPQSWPGTQSPHNDGSFLDEPPRFVALFCNHPAAHGGESTFVSTRSIFEAVCARFSATEIAPLFVNNAYAIQRGATKLTRKVFDTTTGEDGGLRLSAYFSAHEYNRVYPSMTALPVFDFIREYVRRPENQMRVELQAGDCLVFENMALLHGRLRWADTKDRRRLCTRSWYSGGSLPPGIAIRGSYDIEPIIQAAKAIDARRARRLLTGSKA